MSVHVCYMAEHLYLWDYNNYFRFYKIIVRNNRNMVCDIFMYECMSPNYNKTTIQFIIYNKYDCFFVTFSCVWLFLNFLN